MNGPSLYSLMIKQHKLDKQNFDIDEFPALREAAQNTIQMEESSLFLGNHLHKLEVVPVLSLSAEFAKPFGWSTIGGDFNVTTECLQAKRDLICVATFEEIYPIVRSGRVLAIQFGFFTHESDVLQSRICGFDAITIHADVLDLFEMQYIVEVCRDYRMSCILVVSNRNSLENALQTDCPYIAIWAYLSESFAFDNTFASDSVNRFPSACTPILFAPSLQQLQLQAMHKQGYKLIFQP